MKHQHQSKLSLETSQCLGDSATDFHPNSSSHQFYGLENVPYFPTSLGSVTCAMEMIITTVKGSWENEAKSYTEMRPVRDMRQGWDPC